VEDTCFGMQISRTRHDFRQIHDKCRHHLHSTRRMLHLRYASQLG
jgi:hypothetical protein